MSGKRFPTIPNEGVAIQYGRTLFPSEFAVRGIQFAAQRRASKCNKRLQGATKVAPWDAKGACRALKRLLVPAKDLRV